MKNILFLILLVSIASCVSNKQVQYLQKEDVNVKDGVLIKDSVLRTYEIEVYDYKVQAQDVIFISVESLTPDEFNILSYTQLDNNNFGLANGTAPLFGEMVDENGDVEFPVIGKVNVGGLSILEIQEKIKNIAENYLEEPVVKVRMMNFRFTVLGEVNREGSVTTFNNRITVLEALGLAGGLSELADRNSVKLVRQQGNTVEVQYINLLDEEFINSPFYYIHQNDILIVPPLKQRPFRRYFGENLSLFISSLSLLLLVLQL